MQRSLVRLEATLRHLLLAGFFALGCGGSTEDTRTSQPGSGGSGGDGTGGGGVGPPAQASLVFAYGPPSVPGSGCAISSAGSAFIGGPPRSATGEPGPHAVDGVDGVTVSCSVSGSGTFSLSGRAVKNVTSFALLSGTLVSGGRGTARIAVSSPATAGRQLVSPEDAPCELYGDRGSLQVANGRVWAAFSCGLIQNPSQPGSTCGINGEFLFENCEQ
jgi:hypothetical protein